ncbi:MAG: hypothetical protein WC505_07485 [Patescibacteria group bacterium]
MKFFKPVFLALAVMAITAGANADEWQRKPFTDLDVQAWVHPADTIMFRFGPGYCGQKSNDSATIAQLVERLQPALTKMIDEVRGSSCDYLGILNATDATTWKRILSELTGIPAKTLEGVLDGALDVSRGSFATSVVIEAGLSDLFNDLEVRYVDHPIKGEEWRYVKIYVVHNKVCNRIDSLQAANDSLEQRVQCLEAEPRVERNDTTVVHNHYLFQGVNAGIGFSTARFNPVITISVGVQLNPAWGLRFTYGHSAGGESEYLRDTVQNTWSSLYGMYGLHRISNAFSVLAGAERHNLNGSEMSGSGKRHEGPVLGLEGEVELGSSFSLSVYGIWNPGNYIRFNADRIKCQDWEWDNGRIGFNLSYGGGK